MGVLFLITKDLVAGSVLASYVSCLLALKSVPVPVLVHPVLLDSSSGTISTEINGTCPPYSGLMYTYMVIGSVIQFSAKFDNPKRCGSAAIQINKLLL